MFTNFNRILTCSSLLFGISLFTFGQNQLIFFKNEGQVSDQYKNPRKDVLYSGMMDNGVFHLKNNGISYQFVKPDFDQKITDIIPKNGVHASYKIPVYRLDMKWLNANKQVQANAINPVENHSDFPMNSDVKGYRELYYREVYTGIDLHYYQSDGQLKYDFEVKAFADYHQIIFEIEGAEQISLQKDGSVLIQTPYGSIIEEAPIVYQKNKILNSRWKLVGNHLSFELDNYDPKLGCVIDPIVREWGTYYGGNGWDASSKVLVDANNNLFMCGRSASNSSLSIATSGAHQDSIAGDFDAFLVKFNENGTRMWGTFVGGPGVEYGNDIALDANGNIYMVGSTNNNDNTVLTTTGCHQSVYGGGTYDVFLSKFNPSGQLIWSTLYGGNEWDAGFSCQTDAAGNVYITGQSNSTNLSVPGGFQQTFDGGIADAFIAKFNASGTLLWGTYYGGSDYDLSKSCNIDLNGDLYISGYSSSDGTEIATAGSHQPTRGGLADAFLAKFSSTGSRIWSTFYGGAGSEDGGYGFEGYSCVCDAAGNIYMGGVTASQEVNVIASSGSHQPIFGGIQDAFLVKFNSAGVRQWGTYVGGNGVSQGYSCALDQNQNIYFSGMAASDDGSIATNDAFKNSCEAYDNFVVAFNPNGQRLWGTFYGGQSYENSGYCAADNLGNIYLSGSTDMYSSQFQIVTPNGHQTLCHQFQDAYLVKLSLDGSAGATEMEPNGFAVSPNPVKNLLQISNTNTLGAVSVQIYNTLGKLVMQTNLEMESTPIDLSSLTKGFYILNFEKDARSIGTAKIVKE